MLSQSDLSADLTPIPAQELTDQVIKEHYRRALAISLRDEKELYNSEPELLFTEEEMAHLSVEDVLMIDLKTMTVKHPETMAEYQAYVKAQYEADLDAYAHRPPFDGQEVMDVFKEAVRNQAQYVKECYPQWLLDEVDIRLLAIGLVPEKVYRRLRFQEQWLKGKLRHIERQARRAQRKPKIPQDIADAFCFDDLEVISFKKGHDQYTMVLKDPISNVFTKSQQEHYTVVTFLSAILFENELSCDDGLSTDFVTSELYYLDKGAYEVHMLMNQDDDCYVTLQCQDIKIEEVESLSQMTN